MQNEYCGPPCDIGAFDSSDPSCSMPFIPRILRPIMDTCEIPAAPPAIWEVVMPDFPLPPNILFDCRLPKVKSIGSVQVSVEADKEYGACVPNFLFEWDAIDLECPTIALGDTLTEPDPDNGVEVKEGDDPYPPEDPLGPDQVNFEQSYRVTKEPEQVKSVASFTKPTQEECAYEMNFGFVMPCITCTKLDIGNAEDPNDGVIVNVTPGLDPADINAQVTLTKPQMKLPRSGDLDGECVLDPEEECKFEMNFEFDFPLILCSIIDATANGGVDVEVVPGTNLTTDACNYEFQFDFDGLDFCPTMNAGNVPIADPQPCPADPGALPAEPTLEQRTLFAEYWWCPVAVQQFNQDPVAINLALDQYEEEVDPADWRLVPDYNTNLRTSTSPGNEQISTITQIPGLNEPRIFMRTEKPVEEECEFSFGVDIELPELCPTVGGGSTEIEDPGPRPAFPGEPAPNSTKTVRKAHAEYWWWEVEYFQFQKDYASMVTMIARYEDEVPELDRWLVPEYSPFLEKSTSYDKQPKSKIEYVKDLDDPHLFARIEQEDPEVCLFDIAMDLQLPAIICNILAPTGNDAEDPGDRPPNPGLLPENPSAEQRQERADHWWWPVLKNQFDKNLNDLPNNVTTYESIVPEEDRHLAAGYNTNLAASTAPLETQDSTVSIVPAGSDPSIFIRVEREEPDPESGEEDDPCRFRFGVDLTIPLPDFGDLPLNATPFLGYEQDPEGGDDIVTNGDGCITVLLDNNQSQEFNLPGSELFVRVGDQLVVQVTIKPGNLPVPGVGYGAGDFDVEYFTEPAEFPAAYTKPDKAAVEPPTPLVVVPNGAGAIKDGRAIVGFMADSGGESVWTQLLNSCVVIDGTTEDPILFKGIIVGPNPVVQDPLLPPVMGTNNGLVVFTFQDGQTKSHALPVNPPGGDVLPGDSVVLRITGVSDAYTATPNPASPGGIEYDFDPGLVNVSQVVVPLVDTSGAFKELPTVDDVALIGSYYDDPNVHWAGPAAIWVQEFEGSYIFPVFKPSEGIPASLAPGTVLISAGVGEQPYWDYPRYL